MHIISKPKIREFWLQNADAEIPLLNWYKQSKHAEWKSITETKQTFPHADAVGDCTVFNVGGNKYRLVTKINYKKKIIFVRFVLTHAEYDTDKWKEDCRPKRL